MRSIGSKEPRRGRARARAWSPNRRRAGRPQEPEPAARAGLQPPAPVFSAILGRREPGSRGVPGRPRTAAILSLRPI